MFFFFLILFRARYQTHSVRHVRQNLTHLICSSKIRHSFVWDHLMRAWCIIFTQVVYFGYRYLSFKAMWMCLYFLDNFSSSSSLPSFSSLLPPFYSLWCLDKLFPMGLIGTCGLCFFVWGLTFPWGYLPPAPISQQLGTRSHSSPIFMDSLSFPEYSFHLGFWTHCFLHGGSAL